MIFMFEIAGPFRRDLMIEKYGPFRRWIWGWFSVAYIGAVFNDIFQAVRADERKNMAHLGVDDDEHI